ncbi:MAG: hypothetical protein HYT14_02050 [Candidatus Liptonbacteria bacterium]|nr:hypothetical protein [Candidatus Liptonbacteria bacterium]
MRHHLHRLGKTAAIRWLDNVVLIVAVVAPLTNIPQMYELVRTKDAGSVSLASWVLFLLISVPWLAYGVAHKDRQIFWSSAIWLFADLIVVGLIIVYS